MLLKLILLLYCKAAIYYTFININWKNVDKTRVKYELYDIPTCSYRLKSKRNQVE